MKKNTRTGKRKLNKFGKTVVIAGVAIIALMIGWSVVGNLFETSREDKSTADTLDNVHSLSVGSDENSGYDVTLEWSDEKIQNAIHAMSHQKVVASKKWSAVEMTQERIETLSEIVDQNEDGLEHYGTYRGILDRWIDGDFSQVDKDHNSIWTLQDGTVGKATGIATPEDEQKYIDSTFE